MLYRNSPDGLWLIQFSFRACVWHTRSVVAFLRHHDADMRKRGSPTTSTHITHHSHHTPPLRNHKQQTFSHRKRHIRRDVTTTAPHNTHTDGRRPRQAAASMLNADARHICDDDDETLLQKCINATQLVVEQPKRSARVSGGQTAQQSAHILALCCLRQLPVCSTNYRLRARAPIKKYKRWSARKTANPALVVVCNRITNDGLDSPRRDLLGLMLEMPAQTKHRNRTSHTHTPDNAHMRDDEQRGNC